MRVQEKRFGIKRKRKRIDLGYLLYDLRRRTRKRQEDPVVLKILYESGKDQKKAYITKRRNEKNK